MSASFSTPLRASRGDIWPLVAEESAGISTSSAAGTSASGPGEVGSSPSDWKGLSVSCCLERCCARVLGVGWVWRRGKWSDVEFGGGARKERRIYHLD